MVWNKIEPIVLGERKRFFEQYGMVVNYLEDFEYLVAELKKHRKITS